MAAIMLMWDSPPGCCTEGSGRSLALGGEMVTLGRLLAVQVAQSVRFRMCFGGKAIHMHGQSRMGCSGEEKRMRETARRQPGWMGVPFTEVQKLGGN